MNKKNVFAVLIAIGVFLCIIFIIEGYFSFWQVITGFVVGIIIGFGRFNSRNSLMIFFLVLILLLSGYFSIRFKWYGIIPGGLFGFLTAFALHVGWINQYKPFSREQYIRNMKED